MKYLPVVFYLVFIGCKEASHKKQNTSKYEVNNVKKIEQLQTDPAYFQFEKSILHILSKSRIQYSLTLPTQDLEELIFVEDTVLAGIIEDTAYKYAHYYLLFKRNFNPKFDWAINIILYSKFRITAQQFLSGNELTEENWIATERESDSLYWESYFNRVLFFGNEHQLNILQRSTSIFDSLIVCNGIKMRRDKPTEDRLKDERMIFAKNLDKEFLSGNILQNASQINFYCYRNDSIRFNYLEFEFTDNNSIHTFLKSKAYRAKGSSSTEGPEYFIIRTEKYKIKMMFYYEEKFSLFAEQFFDCIDPELNR